MLHSTGPLSHTQSLGQFYLLNNHQLVTNLVIGIGNWITKILERPLVSSLEYLQYNVCSQSVSTAPPPQRRRWPPAPTPAWTAGGTARSCRASAPPTSSTRSLWTGRWWPHTAAGSSDTTLYRTEFHVGQHNTEKFQFFSILKLSKEQWKIKFSFLL